MPAPIRLSPLQNWRKCLLKPVTEEVERHHCEEDSKPGEGRHPPLIEDVILADRDHRAPFWCRRLRPQADEGEASCCEDGVANVKGDLDDDRCPAVGQDVTEDHVCIARAGGPCRINELLLAQ